MLTRKETRKVLVEWKGFLKEAKQTGNQVVVRLFDFDGTLSAHPDPDINRIISNPFMASMLNEKVLVKYVKECKLPAQLQSVLSEKQTDNVKNYVISKVTSVGFPYNRAQVIQKIQEAADDNFKALRKIVESFDLGDALVEGNAKKLSKVLNFPNVDTDPDSTKITNDHLVRVQELKIDEFLMKNKANVEKVYVKTNIAETSIDEKSGKVERIPGTSGKAEVTQRIVKRTMSEYPGKKFTFEVYDNSSVGIAEVTEGILVADDYVPNTTYMNNREKNLYEELFGQLQRSPNVNLKKFFASQGEAGIELDDVSDHYFTKSKSKEGSPEARFKRIKNLFLDLSNFYAMAGRATGRKNEANVTAMRKYFQDHGFDLLTEVLDNVYSHTRAAEDIVGSYDHVKLNKLVDQLYSWSMDNASFKKAIVDNGGSFVAPEEVGDDDKVSPVAKAKAKARAATNTTAQQMPDPTQGQQQQVPPEGEPTAPEEDTYTDDEMYADMADAERQDKEAKAARKAKTQLKESLNKLRLILKKR